MDKFSKLVKMLKNTIVFLCVIYGVVNASYDSPVPFIKPCKANHNDCQLAANVQIAIPYLAEGIPELDIPAAEPMNFENITMKTSEYFKFVLPRLKVEGAKKCKLVDFKLDQHESTMKMTIDCPFVATGTYKFSGKICIFDIDKEGDFKIQTDAMRTTMTMNTSVTAGPDGKKYWNLLNYTYSYEPVESMHVELADLFAGDVSKALPYLSAVGKNWDADVLKVGEPIASDIVKNFFDVLKTFFLHVSIDQIAFP